ncbi:hypothetical protein [Alkalihalobacillus pseudalcaliphilus]|uniref:hypothetical protein n=1 Tax=Alkalihalobacillus pseudalcaliphilus TaxID=79884 RepID=UPI00064D7D31|nr:hypothetical protein [Alkalihalobacillus pseudalcaliphilus]KMK74740.1 hypothetical protein AB990_19845 [Alkalihalobacillus pseudalcaliphilus]
MERYRMLLNQWLEQNKLVKVETTSPVHGRSQFIGRLIKIDDITNSMIFYEDDLKEVFHFTLEEIDTMRVID